MLSLPSLLQTSDRKALVACASMVALLAVVFAEIATAADGASAGIDWPRFRGPGGDGLAGEVDLPVTWSETEHVRWKTAIHGKAWSSPVVRGQQIWLTTATEDGKKLSALCVDRQSGRVVHDLVVFEIAEPQFCHDFNSYASCTPVIEGDRLWVHYGSHGTACLDTTTGKTLWTRQDLPCDHHRGAASSPIIYRDLLVVAFDGFDLQYVVALDKRTGKTVWRRDRNIDYGSDNGDVKKAYGTAGVFEIDNRPQLVYPSAGATIAYDPEQGNEIWRVRHGGMNANSTPLMGNGLMYLNTASGGLKLFAMKVGGTGDLTNTNIEWKCSQGVPTRSSQILLGQLMFMTSEAGIATCLDATNGKVIWQKRLSGEFSASPVYAKGRIYFSNQDGASFVIAASKEYELLSTNYLDDGCMASPAVSDGALILRTKTHLYSLK